MSFLKISVILPVYEDLEGLKTTLESLETQNYSNYEVIVVNDGADEKINSYCKTKNVIVENITPNQGSYNARNRGIRISTGEILAFIDADITAPRDWLTIGINAMETCDYLAGDVQINLDKVKTIAEYHDYCTAFTIMSYMNNLHFGVTANLFVKRKVFDKVGFFDGELRSGGDLEFGNRVYLASIEQRFNAACKVYHPPRNHKEKKVKLKRVKRGQELLLKKYPERFHFLEQQISIIQFVRDFLPPSIKSVRQAYVISQVFSLTVFYLYSFKLKFYKSRVKYFYKY